MRCGGRFARIVAALVLLAGMWAGTARSDDDTPRMDAPRPEVVHWARTYGGAEDDKAWDVELTPGGGYVVAGQTESNGAGGNDMFLLNVDRLGASIWMKFYGGLDQDRAYSVATTSDGGFIIAGGTFSKESEHFADIIVIKLDAAGDRKWTQTLGGTGDESAHAVRQTPDGGYVVAGETNSFGPAVKCEWGPCRNAWVVKLDAEGATQWTHFMGGPQDDVASDIQTTNDGGYIVAGNTRSYGSRGYCAGQVCSDAWLIKLDAWGAEEWNYTYGGGLDDAAVSVRQASDNGYVFAGNTRTYGRGNACDGEPCADGWIVYVDSVGKIKWDYAFGGDDYDAFSSIRQTEDGGFILGGETRSYGGQDRCGREFCTDMWLIKLDGVGHYVWSRAYGDRGDDSVTAVRQTPDLGYIVAGYTGTDGVGSEDRYTVNDTWLLKLDPEGNCRNCFIPPRNPEPRPAVTRQEGDEEQLTDQEAAEFLETWRQAWNSRDIGFYSGFYDGRYFVGKTTLLTGEYKAMQYGMWMDERRREFERAAWIRASVRDLYVIRPRDSGKTALAFNLTFESDLRTELGNVILVVERQPEGIRVVEEEYRPADFPGRPWDRVPGYVAFPAKRYPVK